MGLVPGSQQAGAGGVGGRLAARRSDADLAARGPVSLNQVLQVFRALLRAGETADLGAADALVWAYLRSAQGLRAQIEAMDVLRQATFALTRPSALRGPLLDALDGHVRRLNRASA